MKTILLVAHLTDTDLIDRVDDLARAERNVTADLIAALEELDRRRLYLPAGYTSLFLYCTKRLRLSEGAAYSRIEAARAARRFPEILSQLADGSITRGRCAVCPAAGSRIRSSRAGPPSRHWRRNDSRSRSRLTARPMTPCGHFRL